MQRQIAKRAWYETYGAKRIILREGHPARCFYFVLSGQAVVTAYDTDIQKENILMFLKQEDSFGEQAIMTESRRESTVISNGNLELLVMDDETFTDLFMAGGLKHADESFFRRLPMFRSWPLHLLGEETPGEKRIIFSFFKPGTVLCADTKNSDWIYIVKSGSFSVMKKLKAYRPVKKRKEKIKEEEQEIEEEETVELRLLESIKEREEDIDRPPETSSRLKVQHYELPIELKIKRNKAYEERMEKQERLRQEQIERAGSRNTLPRNVDLTNPPSRSEKLASTLLRKGSYLSREPSRVAPSDEDGLKSSSTPVEVGQKTPQTNSTAPSRSTEKRSITSQKHSSSSSKSDRTEEQVYVNVRILTRGFTFGLEDVLYGQHTDFSLVSNGVECIMIQKKFYEENSEPVELVRLRDDISPYPLGDELQDKLECYVLWGKHRQRTLTKQLADIKEQKRLAAIKHLSKPLPSM